MAAPTQEESFYITSSDFGKTWSNATTILTFESRGQVAKVSANPIVITSTGRWILPFWQEPHTQYDLGQGNSGVLISDDKGTTWKDFGHVHRNDTWLIENTLASFSDGAILQLFRTKLGYIYQSWSTDNGVTWTNATATTLENPDAKVCMRSSSVGVAYLAFNPSKTERIPLVVNTSKDGKTWSFSATLDSDPSTTYQYPTPLPYGNKVYTSYSADTRNGIKLAISSA
eukprot:m.7665 g.7665  ORF g.7665 m.7665 type:complete len:228 (-) comp5858_c0_seq1:56-739(-)